jgi:hypothetical protein
MTTVFAYLPWDIVWTHILPLCDIDTRIAFQVTPGRIDPKAFNSCERILISKLQMMKRYGQHAFYHIPVSGTGKVIQFRATNHDATFNLVDYWDENASQGDPVCLVSHIFQ